MHIIPTTDGVQLAVHDFGGHGTRVLAAHATGFCATTWRPVAGHLATAQVIAPDFRGHGHSVTPPDYPYAWDRFADDVLATIDGTGWADNDDERPVGIGHSMGGAALLLAELRRPGTFRALWVFEPITFPPATREFMANNDNPLSAGARRRRSTFNSPDDAIATFGAKPPMNTFAADALAAYVEGGFAPQEDGHIAIRCRPDDEATVYATASGCVVFEHLHEVRCPTVVARGRKDEFGPSAIAGDVADALANGQLLAFDQLSHFGPMEAPAEIAAAIAALL